MQKQKLEQEEIDEMRENNEKVVRNLLVEVYEQRDSYFHPEDYEEFVEQMMPWSGLVKDQEKLAKKLVKTWDADSTVTVFHIQGEPFFGIMDPSHAVLLALPVSEDSIALLLAWKGYLDEEEEDFKVENVWPTENYAIIVTQPANVFVFKNWLKVQGDSAMILEATDSPEAFRATTSTKTIEQSFSVHGFEEENVIMQAKVNPHLLLHPTPTATMNKLYIMGYGKPVLVEYDYGNFTFYQVVAPIVDNEEEV